MTDDTARAEHCAGCTGTDYLGRPCRGCQKAHHAARPSGLLRGRFDHWYLDADDPKNDASWIHGWNECLDTVRAALATTEPGLDEALEHDHE